VPPHSTPVLLAWHDDPRLLDGVVRVRGRAIEDLGLDVAVETLVVDADTAERVR